MYQFCQLFVVIITIKLNLSQKLPDGSYDASPCTFIRNTLMNKKARNCAVIGFNGWANDDWYNTPNWEMTDHSTIDFEVYTFHLWYDFQQIIFGWHNRTDIVDLNHSFITITHIQQKQGIRWSEHINVSFSATSFPVHDANAIVVNSTQLHALLITNIKMHIEWSYNSTITDTDGVYPTYLQLFGIPHTFEPTLDPTLDPTIDPTLDPTTDPTIDPTFDPTTDPTIDPTTDPTNEPTTNPTNDPTNDPTYDPTIDPSVDPTNDPTSDPTYDPTIDPTNDPTTDPTIDPTYDPTSDPTYDPTNDPTIEPTYDPTHMPTPPTNAPSDAPSLSPTFAPSMSPTSHPTFTVVCNFTSNADCDFSIDDMVFCCSYLSANSHRISKVKQISSYEESALTQTETLKLFTKIRNIQ
eukprot:304005_1